MIIKVKTSGLEGAALDWAVAKCEGREFYQHEGDGATCMKGGWTDYSEEWAKGGPIIERWEIDLNKVGISTWRAKTISLGRFYDATGKTPLIAAMRCYVASKLGDEVEIPKELTQC